LEELQVKRFAFLSSLLVFAMLAFVGCSDDDGTALLLRKSATLIVRIQDRIGGIEAIDEIGFEFMERHLSLGSSTTTITVMIRRCIMVAKNDPVSF
jgi:hypothetical protein